MDNTTSDTIWVLVNTSDIWRGGGEIERKGIDARKLSENMKHFLEQMGVLLKEAQEYVGQFHFEEFELSAEVSADGSLAILGTGLQAGAKGGLKFVFRRSPSSQAAH